MSYDFLYNTYSEEEIREYIERSSEEYITLSDNGITCWEISKYQTLSESFIREFQAYVNWCAVSLYQNLSEEFLIEFIEKVDSHCLECNKIIPEDVKNRIKNLKKLLETA